MDQSSDSDSRDSERGVRYKTDSLRHTEEAPVSQNSFGPALPPHLLKNQSIGPVLPPHLRKDNQDIEENARSTVGPETFQILGPALPPHLKKSLSDESEREHQSAQVIGPSLPLHLQKSPENTDSIIGPCLPPHLQGSNNTQPTQNISIGPSLPGHLRQVLESTEDPSDEEDVYGPVPEGFTHSKSHVELEERALQMKIDMLNPQGDKEPVREEWMLELPAVKAAHFGLGPRQFRAKEAPDLSDRSSWTDTPEDRAKKKEKKDDNPIDLKREVELKEIKKRDKEQEVIVKKHKRSKDSLVEMHMKKIKKKKEESGPSERRPFSREVDLQINRFDEAQKKAVLKKAQLLDTRFSAGESKFL